MRTTLDQQFRFDIKTKGIDYALDKLNERLDHILTKPKEEVTEQDATDIIEYMRLSRAERQP